MAKKRASIPSWQEMKDGMASAQEADDWAKAVLEANRPEDDEEFEVVDAQGPTMRTTSSSNPKKPRTIKAGYDYRTGTMTVVFRDGTWWDYYEVPESVWYDFTISNSKGDFLWNNGFDKRNPKVGQLYEMGPSNIERMPVSKRKRLNGTTLPTLDQYLFGRDF